MSILVDSYPNTAAPSASAVPLLHEVPALLEYRSEADPDAEFIPKTVAGFAGAALAMGMALIFAETMLSHPHVVVGEIMQGMMLQFAFALGIVGVSTSLLLVGLKVRADHSAVALYAKHWLNSIGTGGLYALMMYGPWVLVNHSIIINRFLAAGILMAILSFPAIAAKWTIGPHKELPRPTPGN